MTSKPWGEKTPCGRRGSCNERKGRRESHDRGKKEKTSDRSDIKKTLAVRRRVGGSLPGGGGGKGPFRAGERSRVLYPGKKALELATLEKGKEREPLDRALCRKVYSSRSEKEKRKRGRGDYCLAKRMSEGRGGKNQLLSERGPFRPLSRRGGERRSNILMDVVNREGGEGCSRRVYFLSKTGKKKGEGFSSTPILRPRKGRGKGLFRLGSFFS